jgi:hypothetical protein
MVRMWVLGVGLAGVALLLVLAAVDMPERTSTSGPAPVAGARWR